ncbi:MAG: hypothetical protein JXA90_05640 [Planctomycetes bacterium]|nr:hypothetical protein [Planctomycetota bacterium]
MFQIVVLVMVVGLLVVIVNQLGKDAGAPVVPSAPPAATPEPEPGVELPGVDDLGGEEILEVDVATAPVEPEPFEEKPEVLYAAAAQEARRELDVDAVLYLFHKLRAGGEELISSKPELSTRRGDNVWELLVKKPNLYRGKLVEIAGNLHSRVPADDPVTADRQILFPSPNPAGVPLAYRALVLHEGKLFLVSTWKKTRTFSHRDGVVVRGLFCQLYTYEVNLQGEPQEARIPLVVSGELEVLPPVIAAGNRDWKLLFTLVMVLVAIAALVILAVSQWTQRSYDARLAAARQRTILRRNRPEPEGGSAGAASPPSGEHARAPSGEPPEPPTVERPPESSGAASGESSGNPTGESPS